MLEPPTLKETIIIWIKNIIYLFVMAIQWIAIYVYFVSCMWCTKLVIEAGVFPSFLPSEIRTAYEIGTIIALLSMIYIKTKKQLYIAFGILGLINLFIILLTFYLDGTL